MWGEAGDMGRARPSRGYHVDEMSSSNLAPPKSAAARNPISIRLYKVLGATYDDAASRDALETLSDFYHQPAPKTGDALDHQDTPTDEDVAVEAATARILGRDPPAPIGLAARARKGLRRDAEEKVAQGSRGFLRAFRDVDKKLELLQNHVSAMRVRCDEAHAQLQSTNEACKSLLDRAGGLRAQRHSVADRQAVADTFLAHFTLNPEEIEAIQSRDIPVGQRFFQAVGKADKIRENCRVLMAGEDGPTQAGLDIMAATSQQLEKSYEKIARWCSLEFRHLSRDAQLDVNMSMRESIRWLRKRPELLNEVLATLAQTRQASLLNNFMDALTRGGPGGMPRPIEIHAHDPMRYVGDMLAWVHQAIAGEREFLDALFAVKGDGRMVGSVRTFPGGQEEEWIQELMDSAFEKLCSPLKIRVRQTVRSQESPIISYKVANLLQFYTLTMRRTVGERAVLSTTLNEITDTSYRAFSDTVEAQARSLARTLLPADQDVQPPFAVLDHTQVLRELMSVYDSSLVGDETAAEQQAGFQSILDTMVDAALDMCNRASDAHAAQRPTWDGEVFMLNCLTHLRNVIKPYSFTAYKVNSLQGDIDSREARLVEDHFRNLLCETHLDQCIGVCNTTHRTEPISRVGAMQPPQLAKALWHFSTWLSSPDVVQPARLALLIDQRLSERIHLAALRRLARAYEEICSEVRRPENRYEAANTMLGSQRPFGQMGALRQILGLDEESTEDEEDEEDTMEGSEEETHEALTAGSGAPDDIAANSGSQEGSDDDKSGEEEGSTDDDSSK